MSNTNLKRLLDLKTNNNTRILKLKICDNMTNDTLSCIIAIKNNNNATKSLTCTNICTNSHMGVWDPYAHTSHVTECLQVLVSSILQKQICEYTKLSAADVHCAKFLFF